MTNGEKLSFRTIGSTVAAVGVGYLAGWQWGLLAWGVLVYMIPSDFKDI